MLKRELSHLLPFEGPVPEGTRQLEREGHLVLRDVFEGSELFRIRAAVKRIYAEYAPDDRPGLTDQRRAQMYRYEIFNRSAACQEAIAHPRIRQVLDPLLGFDHHVINNTAWRNPPGAGPEEDGVYFWHTDAGPHVPRPEGVPWPDSIPYPIFVVATHIYLEDCAAADGPTAVIPTSHRSGQLPPQTRRFDSSLSYAGHSLHLQEARAGDVSFFVSDVWHRRHPPSPSSRGRLFIQTNFGRRDIAQRVRPSDSVNHVGPEADRRAKTRRERLLLGLHDPAYYDG